MAALGSSGCGVITDMAEDNEWRFGYFGNVEFVSPVKLRVGVAPFSDEVGLGPSETGYNLANLMAEELNHDSRLLVVSVDEVRAAMGARGYTTPMTPQEASEVGAALRLNAIVQGSVSEIKKYNIRKGWRRIARVVTSQREYVDAVLSVSAVDAQTGIVLVSRANVGEYDAGAGKDFTEAGDTKGSVPDQEAIEGSLDDALKESYYRTRQGLAALPFKAKALTVYNGQVSINVGSEVGLKKGQKFAKLEVENVITNTIGETYHVMGAPVARLKIVELTETSAILEITEGYLYPGDIIQTIK
ncbi:hypothetical protein LJB99_03065 [Deltaproteobacteria bacterium OttesenSCG-928-K17]|nr:hypothetical protein [Deltaproteobacteria bacterium OttesenSCG-928-K17]